MDSRVVKAVVVGLILYAIDITVFIVQGDVTGVTLLLFFLTPFIIGFFSRGVKRGLAITFIFSLIVQFAEMLLSQPGGISDVNILMAVLIIFLINSAIFGVIGAVGGFVGGRMLKRDKGFASRPTRSESKP